MITVLTPPRSDRFSSGVAGTLLAGGLAIG